MTPYSWLSNAKNVVKYLHEGKNQYRSYGEIRNKKLVDTDAVLTLERFFLHINTEEAEG